MNSRLQYLKPDGQLKTQAVQALYTRYAGPLLGYITDVVNNKQEAEEYLVETFKHVALNLDDFFEQDNNEYCRLQALARKKLSGYFEAIKDCSIDAIINGDARYSRHVNEMTLLQQQVFCGVHYHGKSTAILATELGVTEDTVRKTLKEAFLIIRK